MIELTIQDDGSIEGVVIANATSSMSSVRYASIDNVPDEIKTKLSVLQLACTYDELASIGQKVTDRIYWIYTAEDGNFSFMDSLSAKIRMSEALRKGKSLREILNQNTKEGNDIYERITKLFNRDERRNTWVCDNSFSLDKKSSTKKREARKILGVSSKIRRAYKWQITRRANKRI